MYFFSDSYTRFASQKTAAECEGLFESYSPQGGTGVLWMQVLPAG